MQESGELEEERAKVVEQVCVGVRECQQPTASGTGKLAATATRPTLIPSESD